MITTGSNIPSLIHQRRWWLVALALWAGAVGLSWQSHMHDIQHQSILVATEGARNMFRMVVLTRLWNASHGGVYVPISPQTQPNAYLDHPRRDITTTDGTQLTLINPAYMTRLIAEMAKLETGAIFRLTSLKPIRPLNAPDAWEEQSLLAFEQGVKEVISVEPSKDGALLRYMAPLTVDKPCLQCHAKQGYKLGDVRGGISVSQRYADIEAANGLIARQSSLIHSTVFVLIATLGWWMLALLRRRWFDLTGKMAELEDTRGVLVQSEKMASLGRMVAGFAHEINTPVGVAVGAISQHEEILQRIDKMLHQEDVNEEELRAELLQLQQGGALALSNLRRAAHLVQSFKRTSIDQTSEQVRQFGMKQLIEDVCFTLQHTLKRLPVSFQIDCADKLQITGSPGLLEQLLTNLIMNSVQHGFDNGARAGQISIEAKLDGEYLVLHFADNGAGMTSDQLQRIFEPFYTTRRTQGGSGLGLYICYNIVRTQLCGSIECDSAPDAGSRFTIKFPAQPASNTKEVTA